jgi:hypothetical protein
MSCTTDKSYSCTKGFIRAESLSSNNPGPHIYPSFPVTKIPSVIRCQYQDCINAAGPVGMSTLRADKGVFPYYLCSSVFIRN